MGTTSSHCFSLSCHDTCRRSSQAKLTLTGPQSKTIDQLKNTINLNRASEDEFLLLPGINRQLAQNIVEYRHRYGEFKQVDELLQVNGIDLSLFKKIRSEISVDPPPPKVSISATDQKSTLVNLNFATYEELCRVPGLNELLAQRIVQRRERKGIFRFVEDLLQIKGIDYVVLAQVRPHVTVHVKPLVTSFSHLSIDNLSSTFNGSRRKTRVGSTATETLSIASQLLDTLPVELQSILLSSPPAKPLEKQDPDQSLVRLASWNLKQLTVEKVRNPGVREVICRTIIHHNLSLIGVQEIENEQALSAIVDELNNPTIPSLKELIQQSKQRWKLVLSDANEPTFQGCEYLGFIYDESVGIELKQVMILRLDKPFVRTPFMVNFRLREKYEWLFVNLHLKGRETEEHKKNLLTNLVETIQNTMDETFAIIFGDFNLTPTSTAFQALLDRQFTSMINDPTDICLNQMEGTTCLDSIWLSPSIKSFSTQKSGVIRDNLTSLWIPAGWSWGGLVSNHCPIWTEFHLS